jgi:hypothetical protein
VEHKDQRERYRRHPIKLLGEFEAALSAQIVVYQRHVRVCFPVNHRRFNAIRRHTDNADPRALKHRALTASRNSALSSTIRHRTLQTGATHDSSVAWNCGGRSAHHRRTLLVCQLREIL